MHASTSSSGEQKLTFLETKTFLKDWKMQWMNICNNKGACKQKLAREYLAVVIQVQMRMKIGYSKPY